MNEMRLLRKWWRGTLPMGGWHAFWISFGVWCFLGCSFGVFLIYAENKYGVDARCVDACFTDYRNGWAEGRWKPPSE